MILNWGVKIKTLMADVSCIKDWFSSKVVLFLSLVLVTASVFTVAPNQTGAQSANPVFVQGDFSTDRNTNALTANFGQATTPGNLLVAFCSIQDASSIDVPSGFDVAISESGAPAHAIFYKIADGSEGSVTCTGSVNTDSIGIFIYEYSGIATDAPILVDTSSGSGNSNSLNTGSVAVDADSLLVAGAVISEESEIQSWSDSFEELDQDGVSTGQPAGRNRHGTAFRVGDALNTFSTTATTSGSGSWRAQIAAFRLEGADPGSLDVGFVDSSSQTVGDPSIEMSPLDTRFECQQSSSDLGTQDQLLRVSNTTFNPGWNVSIAATNGPGGEWSSTDNSYSFNDPDGDGCDNGQLSINPSSASVDPGGCSLNGVSLGADESYIAGSVDDITIINSDASSDIGCDWDVTGVGVEQQVPAEVPAGEYSLDLTLTITAQ